MEEEHGGLTYFGKEKKGSQPYHVLPVHSLGRILAIFSIDLKIPVAQGTVTAPIGQESSERQTSSAWVWQLPRLSFGWWLRVKTSTQVMPCEAIILGEAAEFLADVTQVFGERTKAFST